MLCRITIKNYRCFTDQTPAVFELDECFTAIVGPNNSGKSSLLRMFYEFRHLWTVLSSVSLLVSSWSTDNQIVMVHGPNPQNQGIDDPHEVFSDSNKRPLSLRFEFPTQAGSPYIQALSLTANRPRLNVWALSLHTDTGVTVTSKADLAVDPTKERLTLSGQNCEYKPVSRVFALLARSMYISAFRNAVNAGAAQHYDLTFGTGFIELWDAWQTGGNKTQMQAVSDVAADIRAIFHYSQLDISASKDNKKLIITVNGKAYKDYEMGAGLSQFAIVFGNVATKQPSFVLIDEPELNLHPSLQIDFLTSLRRYAECGVIFSTHSIGLARSTADVIYSVQMNGATSRLRKYEATVNMAEFLGEMSFSTVRDLGFDRLLLVEGGTDVKTMQQFLRKLEKDHTVLVLPLGGDRVSGDSKHDQLNEVKRITPNVFVLVDSERLEANGAPMAQREKFAGACGDLGFKVHLTNLRATENYLCDRAVKAVIGHEARGLGPYERLQDAPYRWPKHRNWEIAAEMTLDEMMDTDLGKFLAKL